MKFDIIIIRFCTRMWCQVAKLSVGGRSLGGNFFEPTLLLDVITNIAVAREENPRRGRTRPSFKIEAEAIEMVNATEFGIAC